MLLLLALACRDPDTGDVAATPDPPAPGPGGMAFTERTEDWGLATVNGAQLQAVDLDHDGWPDLVADDNVGIDDFAGGPRYHWVLMNRPDGAGGRTFVDETVASGLFQRREGDGGRPSVDHVFADVDGDGDVDAFAGVYNDPHTDPATHFSDFSDVLLNDGAGRFSFAPVSADLQVDFPMSGVTFTDADADGILDLYIGLWYVNDDLYGDGTWLNWVFGANDRLLRGNGDGTFADVTDAAGLDLSEAVGSTIAWNSVLNGSHARPTMGVTACDLDGDALPELLAMAYGRQWNLHWANQGDGTFEEVGETSGYAGDDNVDYTDNWYYQCWCWSNGECDRPSDPDFPYTQRQCDQVAAYWNPGWDDEPANLNGNTFSTACADVDDDGDLDLWNGEIYHQWAGASSDRSGLLLNDGAGNFSRPDPAAMGLERTPVVSPDTGSWDFGDQKAAVADLDNDGRKDLLLPSGAGYYGNKLYAFRQWDTLQFSEVQDDVGLVVPTAHGIAFADFDRDGDLDVVAASLSELVEGTEAGHRLYFFQNDVQGAHSVRIRLDADASNTMGVGARVAVTAGGKTQVQEVVGGYGQHGMQHETTLTFGLGDAAEIDGIEVVWPGGATDAYAGVAADTQVVLTQGGGVTVEEAQ